MPHPYSERPLADDAWIMALEWNALAPHDLARAAEIAGSRMRGERIVNALLKLLHHPLPIVRSGALYGLRDHMEQPGVREAILTVASEDEDQELRQTASVYTQKPAPGKEHSGTAVAGR